jgi:hypothetical protein
LLDIRYKDNKKAYFLERINFSKIKKTVRVILFLKNKMKKNDKKKSSDVVL